MGSKSAAKDSVYVAEDLDAFVVDSGFMGVDSELVAMGLVPIAVKRG